MRSLRTNGPPAPSAFLSLYLEGIGPESKDKFGMDLPTGDTCVTIYLATQQQLTMSILPLLC